MRRSLLVVAVVASVLVSGAPAATAALPAGTWGGAVTATDGETVTVGSRRRSRRIRRCSCGGPTT